MQHLDIDRLAALADEPATDTEAQHLAACVACRRELEAFTALLDLAHRDGQSGLDPDLPAPLPLTSWDALAPALRAEGLIKSVRTTGAHAVPAAPTPVRVTRIPAGWRRAAASVALLVGGAAFGRLTASAAPATSATAPAPAPVTVAAQPQAPAPAPKTDSVAAPHASLGLSDTIPVAGEPRAGGAQLASLDPDAPLTFTSPRQAMQILTRAQRDYQRAAAYLAEHDTTSAVGTPQMLRARLAALDEVMPKVREALYEAPQDPMLNQYYLTTYEARESTLRQLGKTLPVNVRLNAY
jgi:hypothetical protein